MRLVVFVLFFTMMACCDAGAYFVITQHGATASPHTIGLILLGVQVPNLVVAWIISGRVGRR